MKPESLRSEFILTGGATLLALYLLVVSIERRSRASCYSHGQIMKTCNVHLFAIPHQLQNGGTAAVAIAILIGIAFVIGIIIVQLTFFFPTEGLIYVRRQKRMQDLRSLDTTLRNQNQYQPCCDSNYAILEKAFRKPEKSTKNRGSYHEFAAFYFRKITRRTPPNPEEERLVFMLINIGRQLAPDAVIREYEYRRSNRQVFVGVLPAFVIAVAAAAVNPWSSQDSLQVWYEIIAVVIGLIIICALCASANYQERVAQAQLLDTAFTMLWSQHEAGPASLNSTIGGRAHTAAASAPEQPQRTVNEEGPGCMSKE